MSLSLVPRLPLCGGRGTPGLLCPVLMATCVCKKRRFECLVPSLWRCVHALAVRSMKWEVESPAVCFPLCFRSRAAVFGENTPRWGSWCRRLNFLMAPGMASLGFGITRVWHPLASP